MSKEPCKRHKPDCLQENAPVSPIVPHTTTCVSPVYVSDHPKIRGQKALYASRDFDMGEEILCEIPLMTVPETQVSNKPFFYCCLQTFLSLPKTQKEKIFKLQKKGKIFLPALNYANPHFGDPQASPREFGKESFLNVATKCGFSLHSQEEEDEAWNFMTIWNCNAFAFGDAEAAIFQLLSRANHSCSPNMLRREHEDGRQIRCIAASPIKAGDELTNSYVVDVKLMKSKSFRKKQLLENWGFDCQCIRCNIDIDDMRPFHCPEIDCSGHGFASSKQNEISPCDTCGTPFSTEVAAALLQEECGFETEYLDMERNTFSIFSLDPMLDLFQKIKSSDLGESHWLLLVVADLAGDFSLQKACTGQISWNVPCEFYQTILSFWGRVCPRMSLRKSFIQEKYADILSCMYKFDCALELYGKALAQQCSICGASSSEVACVEKKIRQVKKGEPNQPAAGPAQCCIQ